MIPRMLVDCTVRDLSTKYFEDTLPSPAFMSPIGVNGICTQDQHGDIAAAKASAMTGVPFVASTLSNDPLEEVIQHCGDVPAYFQLYTPKNRELAESLMSRAEKAGYRAIVVTLDTWVTGWRPRDLRTANFPQLRGHVLENYFSDPVFRGLLQKSPEEDLKTAITVWAGVFGEVLTWDHIPWLREATDLPIVLKGICHPDDARRAVDMGIDVIYCSNHGGRQANGGLAAIDMLPGVVEGSGDTPVWFDSGVRSGTDLIKAIALGASAVGVGRPYMYGLALGGAEGAAHVLRCMLAEADLLMAVNGYPTIEMVRAAGIQRT
jgi:lactate 2-monooxygenase